MGWFVGWYSSSYQPLQISNFAHWYNLLSVWGEVGQAACIKQNIRTSFYVKKRYGCWYKDNIGIIMPLVFSVFGLQFYIGNFPHQSLLFFLVHSGFDVAVPLLYHWMCMHCKSPRLCILNKLQKWKTPLLKFKNWECAKIKFWRFCNGFVG